MSDEKKQPSNLVVLADARERRERLAPMEEADRQVKAAVEKLRRAGTELEKEVLENQLVKALLDERRATRGLLRSQTETISLQRHAIRLQQLTERLRAATEAPPAKPGDDEGSLWHMGPGWKAILTAGATIVAVEGGRRVLRRLFRRR